jgi:hypothetical protein
MIMVPALLLGVLIGVWTTVRNRGTKLDMLQYGAVYGIAFFILALFLSIGLDWAGWI